MRVLAKSTLAVVLPMDTMLDIHTHILPDMDDGARNVEESKALLHALKADGVTDVVLTPHFYTDEEVCADFYKRRAAAYADLGQTEGIKTYLGAEVYLTKYLFAQKDIDSLCLGKSKLLLLELSYENYHDLPEVLSWIEKLTKDGYSPLIAHPERYADCREQSFMFALRDMGARFVISGGDLLSGGGFGRGLRQLKKWGFCDLLATDCHSPNDARRGACLAAYYRAAAKELGRNVAEAMQQNGVMITKELRGN